ncbi:Enoyl-CoA hydratase [Hyphomicrobiales bacterium]|nr:Enoyl-CoA hydratase [Hyphomicrobiales bacterium]CAH1692321.1 Enoyl-CoA hydratase [Hyphomicrobiales bacterium]
MTADLEVDIRDGQVAVLVLTRADKRNALSLVLIGALQAALERLEAEGLRAMVLAAEGSAFSSGADFSDLTGDGADEAYDAAMSGLTSALEASPVISVAAIHGPCVGAGLDLALACDFRLATEAASFSLPAVKMGILYNPARLATLAGRLSPGSLQRLLLLGERLDRNAAVAAGIVTHAHPGTKADAAVRGALELAKAAADLPPRAQIASKAFLKAMGREDYAPDVWQQRRMELLSSDERRAALRRAKG